MVKGISICMSAVIVALFVIGISAFFYWFIFARFYQLHVLVNETGVQRRTINMANVLLSYEGLTYSTRGVFDKTKLDQLATYLEHPDDSTYATTLQDAINNAQEWDIGYPNSYTTFVVIDLDACSDTCNGWVGAFKGSFSTNAMYANKFIDCLVNNIDLSVGSVFRGLGALTLWQPWDLAKCWQNTLSQFTEKIFFGYTSIPSISSGYPVLIRYPSGELHVGRLLVGVWQWA